MKIPSRLKAILEQDGQLAANVMHVVNPFDDILRNNDLYFFKEYTDHGIKHIEDTLQYVENLIAEDTFSVLTPEEIGIIIIAVVLHDIGMHTNTDMFKNMLDGKYDDVQGLFAEEKIWETLWNEYVYDSRYWIAEKKVNVFGEGEDNHSIKTPNLENPQLLNEYDRKFIGEFIRIHHCRIAYEVAQSGYKGRETLPFNSNRAIPEEMMTIAGIVARSHGMDVRDTFDYLEGQFGDSTTPLGCHAVYLMVLLRLADYLQIDNSRTNKTVLSIGTIYSPYSRQEHQTHQAIKDLQCEVSKEKITVHAMPKDARTYTKIERLTEDIQEEFDRSWAILGEVYPDNNYKLRYRRITTNIQNERYKNNLKYIPRQFCYRFNSELAKLLVAPLYGDDATFGVRELVQNAVDACRECMNDVKAGEEKPHVTVELDTKKRLFTITDTGKGMTLREIEHYFLTIGSSYNGDVNWQKKRDAEHIYRTGRFGIGILAAYLLGPEITVVTRSRSGEAGYRFKASLQDKFIQIDKVPKAAFGTKIEIKCDDRCVADLSSQVVKRKRELESGYRYFSRRWFYWYIDENPRVEYFCDGDNIPLPHFPLKDYKPLQHQSGKFGTILWKPMPLFERYSSPSLYCNGFFVTDDSNKDTFSLPGLDNYYPFHIPSLQIADTYNTLPLNLQRSNIKGVVIYDFEPELAIATLTDLICQLMAIDIWKLKISGDINFYFTKNGLAFKNQYTHDKLRGNHIIEIGVLEDLRIRDWKPIFDLFPDELFYFSFSRFGSRNGLSSTDSEIIARKVPHFFFRKLHFAIPLPDTDSKIFNAIEEYSHGQGYEFENCFIYTPHPGRKQLFEALITKVKEVQSIKEEHGFKKERSIKDWKYIIISDIEQGENTPEFDAVFDKYLHGAPIIPYNTAERANKFQLIHQEYKKEIEEYKKRYNI